MAGESARSDNVLIQQRLFVLLMIVGDEGQWSAKTALARSERSHYARNVLKYLSFF
ncbi:hypothetical protein [Bradyrhizobium oligotrophicum]|uniref:hypothetical protein n=1 Tax=Bradyrhizobium oligotrophicum TaxID=44255 RepID=UPI003EBEF20D